MKTEPTKQDRPRVESRPMRDAVSMVNENMIMQANKLDVCGYALNKTVAEYPQIPSSDEINEHVFADLPHLYDDLESDVKRLTARSRAVLLKIEALEEFIWTHFPNVLDKDQPKSR